MGILLNIVLGAVTALATMWGVYNYVPLGAIEYLSSVSEKKFGATITTINSSDTLRDSRSTINTNFSNLNSDKTEVASSSIDAITTLSNLVTVGTLTSGSLGSGFTTVVVAIGGTGSTTLASN